MTTTQTQTPPQTLTGRDIGLAERATSAALNVVLADIGTTFDRWVVLIGLSSETLPAEVDLLVPALAEALGTTVETAELTLDEAESGGHVQVVSAADGDPRGARVELTAAGRALYEHVRAATVELSGELQAGIPREDLAVARRVLVQITDLARAWLAVNRPAPAGMTK